MRCAASKGSYLASVALSRWSMALCPSLTLPALSRSLVQEAHGPGEERYPCPGEGRCKGVRPRPPSLSSRERRRPLVLICRKGLCRDSHRHRPLQEKDRLSRAQRHHKGVAKAFSGRGTGGLVRRFTAKGTAKAFSVSPFGRRIPASKDLEDQRNKQGGEKYSHNSGE